MVQPANYTINLPQVMGGAVSGIQNALQIAQGMEAADAEKARGALYDAQRAGVVLENEGRVRAADQAKALQDDIKALMAQPTTEAISNMMLKYPHLSEGYQRGLSAISAEEQKARIQEGTQVYAAILNDQPELGAQILKDTATTLRESGNAKQAETYERLAKLIELNPKGALTSVGMMLATAMGADKFQGTFKELEDQRRSRMTEGDVAKEAAAKANRATSEAEVAAVASRFAESNAVLDIQQKGWNIANLITDVDVKKLNMRIAQAELQLKKNQDGRDATRLQMELDKMKRERDETVRTKTAELEQSMGNIDNMLNTLEGVLSSKALGDVVGPIEGSDFYPTTAVAMAARAANIANPFYTPTTADERKSTIAEVNKLIAQSFTTQLEKMRGLGHLSNIEGEKIQSAFANFTRAQGEEGFKASAQEARRLLVKERERIAKKYGMPAPTVDAPKTPGSRPPLESFDR
jgi:hypothetical protein